MHLHFCICVVRIPKSTFVDRKIRKDFSGYCGDFVEIEISDGRRSVTDDFSDSREKYRFYGGLFWG